MLPIVLKGARTHNLRGIDLEIPPGEVVVITGVSGSGKSSLAMDTLYAEGQRRFVESFSPYARQFLERLERPPVDKLEPVPAGIAVDRKTPIKSSRSTVATMSDLEPYLAALFLREALPFCPDHEQQAVSLDPASAAEQIVSAFHGELAVITYPVRAAGTEAYLEVREQLVRDGYRRLWVENQAMDVDTVRPSVASKKSDVLEVVVDRLSASTEQRSRLAADVETAWKRAPGVARAWSNGKSLELSESLSCPTCGRVLEPPRAGLFSYESALGACPQCRGFGRTLGIDPDKVIPDPDRSIDKGAIRPWRGKSTRWERAELIKLCRRHGIPTDVKWRSLSAAQKRLVMQGDGSWDSGMFPGVMGWFSWQETRTYKMHVRVLLSRYRSYDACRACEGKRLNATALSYRVGGRSLADWHALEVCQARAATDALTTRTGQGELARKELQSRLLYLERVGLGYLTLDRQARTLSGGEAQRVTLTAALGTSLYNGLFVLDEPTVGLHASDVEPMNQMLRELAQRNNAVLVVEHDPAIIRAADRVIELGPGAGSSGGSITADGNVSEVVRRGGATARALTGIRGEKLRERRGPSGWLRVRGARENNLRSVDVRLPLGVVCVLSGPSGSGKSTLAVDIVYRALARRLGDFDAGSPGAHDSIEGAEAVRRVLLVDQSPLGRTSRGNAATYTKAWDLVRAQFARQPEAALAGLKASHFSFNVEGGRCDACAGEGAETVEMQFLADVRLVCPVCKGRRFKDEVLAIQFRGYTVSDLLEATVDQTLEIFQSEPAILRSLGPVSKLGLGYLRLGQPLSTLSGGEAQRLKLARTLSQELDGTLLILDEPSAGLHADEVEILLEVLRAIVRAGASALVVEHDLGVIKNADWIVDLGPGAGANGGELVASGTPEQVARAQTRTGSALRAGAPPLGESKQLPAAYARAELHVTRAREHNLRDISASIPHGALCVITGPSGSGKSTLAFDVVFAEGQRRFLETLSPYARQFLPTMARPDVDSVTGVPPSIALEQRTARAGGKSTVATVTEVAHYLRLIFAKLGTVYCPDHDRPIQKRTLDQLFEQVRKVTGAHALLSPAVQARKGTYLDVFTAAARDGITHAWCDQQLVSTDDPPRLAARREHTIDLVMASNLKPSKLDRSLFERALRWGR
ncbi:MAG TPA: excinuclease ABC subunit UvrA, partial [Polyangiaceae bacterium]